MTKPAVLIFLGMLVLAPKPTNCFTIVGGGNNGTADAGTSIDEVERFLRPEPLVILETDQPFKLIEAVKEMVERNGFVIEKWHRPEAFIQAKRLDGPTVGTFDRIAIWIERDFRRPDRVFKIYLVHARYIRLDESGRTFYCVEVDEALEEKQIGPLRQSLIRWSSNVTSNQQ